MGSENQKPNYLKFEQMAAIRPGQVVKLSTSGRLAALLRAAGHWSWCVFGVILSDWDIEKSVELINSKWNLNTGQY